MKFFKRTKSQSELQLDEIKKLVEESTKKLDELKRLHEKEDECPDQTATVLPLKVVR